MQEVKSFHVALGERIAIIEWSFAVLHQQYLDLKCTKKRIRYHCNRESDHQVLKDLLFFGQKCTSGLDIFPCYFQSALDTIWHTVHPDDTSVYYGATRRIKQEQVQEQLQQNGMILSEDPVVTVHDIAVLLRLNRDLLSFMDQALDLIIDKLGDNSDSVRQMRLFRNKVARLIAKYE